MVLVDPAAHVLRRVEPANRRADVIEPLEHTPMIDRQFGNDPFEINDLSLLQLRSAETH
jgi:hypothetical protein